MDLKAIIAQLRSSVAKNLEQRAAKKKELDELRAGVTAAGRTELTAEEDARAGELLKEIGDLDTARGMLEETLKEREAEQERDEAADKAQREFHPTGVTLPGGPESQLSVNSKRTYSEDSDKRGMQFLRDVATQFVFGGAAADASQRLSAHMAEERAERGDLIDAYGNRAAGTGAFAGLVVPQYLVDLYAPKARAGRPFADFCRHHDLPETGMTVYLGKVTTGTTTALQAAEGDTVSETDIDDTLMSIPVQTNAGSQSISRQALERGLGVEDTTVEDLFAAHDTTLDSTLLNQSSTGLTNVATSIAYTDASPTGPELYPKFLAANAGIEAALLAFFQNDAAHVMHSRRWNWLQAQLVSTWPMIGQQGIAPQQAGVNYGEVYGSGFRGVLPNGTPVVVDNNIATNLGTGTNEDEVYTASKAECHLWEDPNAPMLIKAEQNQAKKLLVDLVVYRYFAYTFTRRAHAQKIAGTGLVTPSF